MMKILIKLLPQFIKVLVLNNLEDFKSHLNTFNVNYELFKEKVS
jgi:hypothetical protein